MRFSLRRAEWIGTTTAYCIKKQLVKSACHVAASEVNSIVCCTRLLIRCIGRNH